MFLYDNKEKQAELSWGSVQAETVRLQRQIDPGLINIHLKFTEFCCFFGPKKFQAKKWLGKNNYGS